MTETGETPKESDARQFPCESCGADFELQIGQAQLKCPFCGFEKTIAFDPEQGVVERDLEAVLAGLAGRRSEAGGTQVAGKSEVRCRACGGTVVFEGTLTSGECDYCGSPIQRADVHEAKDRIAVDGVVPFAVHKSRAQENLRTWVKKRWFAPSDFKTRGVQGRFTGLYLPFWTFDAMTQSAYEGQRGDHYYVEVGSGKNKRRERRTRWTRVSGSFSRFFDDVIVCAAKSAAKKLIKALEPWPITQAKPFAAELLAGFKAMTYDVELADGFKESKAEMEEALRAETKRRIGGDEQRIDRLDTSWAALTYKHMLMPVWMLAYRYKDKSYQVVVNAATGEVQGERPWSWVKITLFVLVVTAIAVGIVWLTQR